MKPYQIHGEHQQAAIGNWPQGRTRVPGWLLDKMANEKLMGGYSKKKNPPCPECHVMKSSAGTCFC